MSDASTPPDRGVKEFMLQEYGNYQQTVVESERTGETRVNFLLTVAGAVLAALALRDEGLFLASGGANPIAYVLLLVLLLFGWVTLGRVIHRNLKTDEAIRAIGRMRAYFCDAHPEVLPYLTWPPHAQKTRPGLSLRDQHTLNRGGLAETVILINSLAFAGGFGLLVHQVMLWMAGDTLESGLVGALGGVGGFLLAWSWQAGWVNSRYGAKGGERSSGS